MCMYSKMVYCSKKAFKPKALLMLCTVLKCGFSTLCSFGDRQLDSDNPSIGPWGLFYYASRRI